MRGGRSSPLACEWHGRRNPGVVVEAKMSITGVITTKEVFRHTMAIVRDFGAATYLRCCMAIFTGHRTTFLNCVFPQR
ncbi:MAG TPA: hypothetical protein VE620_07290 [Myxococcales bacterium]|nr:hypothetical protein [Myxococcales bacterium]